MPSALQVASIACGLLLGNLACSTEPTSASAANGTGGAAASSASSTSVASTGAGGGCAEQQLPLLVKTYGDAERYFVEIVLDGQPAALQVDTGAGVSFLYQAATAPPFTPDLATVTLGCDTRAIAGRGLGVPEDTVLGLDVVGVLGADYFLEAPTAIDATGRTMQRIRPDELDTITQSATPLSFDEVQSHMLVPVDLDGEPVRLMFDTGGATLRVGVEGMPGDEEVLVQDAEGTIFTVYEGTATLSAAELAPRTVPILRAPEFPYFDETVNALGGNLHGLLGLEAFVGETLLVDAATSRLFVVR